MPRKPAIILELELFAMNAIETPKKILTSEVCFLCMAKVSSEEKIKVFGKSTMAIHSLILRSTEVDLSVYVGSGDKRQPEIRFRSQANVNQASKISYPIENVTCKPARSLLLSGYLIQNMRSSQCTGGSRKSGIY